jgi:hypothetical protein
MRNPAVVIAAGDAVLITAIAVRGVMVRRVGHVRRDRAVKAVRGLKARVVRDPVVDSAGKEAEIGAAAVVVVVFAGAMIDAVVFVADVLKSGVNCRRFRPLK